MKFMLVFFALMVPPPTEPQFYVGHPNISPISTSISRKVHQHFKEGKKLKEVEIGENFILFEDDSLITIDFSSIKKEKYRLIDRPLYLGYLPFLDDEADKILQDDIRVTCIISTNGHCLKYSAVTCPLTDYEKEWLLASLKMNLVFIFSQNSPELMARFYTAKKYHFVEFERIE